MLYEPTDPDMLFADPITHDFEKSTSRSKLWDTDNKNTKINTKSLIVDESLDSGETKSHKNWANVVTEYVTIGPAQKSDVEQVARILQNPKVCEMSREYPSLIAIHKLCNQNYLTPHPKIIDSLFLTICDVETGQVIGTAQIATTWISQCTFGLPTIEHVPIGALGLTLSPDVWGRGLGTHIMQQLVLLAKKMGYSVVAAETAITNKGMQRVLTKAGFINTGKGRSTEFMGNPDVVHVQYYVYPPIPHKDIGHKIINKKL